MRFQSSPQPEKRFGTEPINVFHDLWQLGLAADAAKEWDTLALLVPEQRREELENLVRLIPDHPQLKKPGKDYTYVPLADQAAPAKWQTILRQGITATFRTVEARDGMLLLVPDSKVQFQEAARSLRLPVRSYYAIMLAYASDRIADVKPLLKQLRANLAKQPFALSFERQLQHRRTTLRTTGFRIGPDFL